MAPSFDPNACMRGLMTARSANEGSRNSGSIPRWRARGVSGLAPAALRAVPLFAGLGNRELEIVARSGLEVPFAAGETVIHRWQGTRNFYVILAGTVGIEVGGERVTEIGAGQYFGELAALDWGAGFGLVRTATVVACEPTRLLMLSPAVLDELLRAAPELERDLRATVRERLQQINGPA
jgi:CRP-like cAMP-binding protein